MSEIVIGEQTYPLIKKGRAQAEQISGLGSWLTNHGMALVSAFGERPEDEESDLASGVRFLGEILGNLSTDALLDLFRIVTGCTVDEAEEHFDAFLLVDSAILVYNEHPSIKKLVDRFFSTPISSDTTEEDSTTSE